MVNLTVSRVFATASSVVLFCFVALMLQQFFVNNFFVGYLFWPSMIVYVYWFLHFTKRELIFVNKEDKYGYTGLVMGFFCLLSLLTAGFNILFLGAMVLFLFLSVALVCVND